MRYIGLIFVMLAALNAANTGGSCGVRVGGETYPAYYDSLERVVLKDSMSKMFGVNKDGILSYGLDDAAKAEGHICPIVTGAFLTSRLAVNALKKDYQEHPKKDEFSAYDYNDGIMYRGGFKVTMGGKEGVGNAANAFGKVVGVILGTEGASGFKGPGYPFANRQNLFLHDPKIPFDGKKGIEVIVTSLKASFTFRDKNGKDTKKPAKFEECKGRNCVEHEVCDRSVKITYKFKTPELLANKALKNKSWPEKIKHILDNEDKAISVQKVPNPSSICK